MAQIAPPRTASPSDDGSGITSHTEVSSFFDQHSTTKHIDHDSMARAKLQTLTLEEKVSLLTAADFWRTKAIPEKEIPSLKTSDGPNGARGGIFVGGTKAALFPCGISLAATWNKSLLYEVGQHLAEETKAREANILLAPTVCLHRHPLGGRNFESFSEDPLLTGKLAAEYIKGLQSNGVAATIKHFVANEQETDRLIVDAVIQERPLRELYLKPFEIAIREANPWALMTAYNSVNGHHADMNMHTLKDILRGEWGYKGCVISDWGGTNSTKESILAGCDIEFPHSEKWRYEKLVAAVRAGTLPESAIDTAALHVLSLVSRLKAFDLTPEAPERTNDRPATRSLIRRAGAEGITLLKNSGSILPLKTCANIAVIGPNAARAIAGGGGSASLNPYYTTTPLAGIQAAAEKTVTFAQGVFINKWLPVASAACSRENGKQGLVLKWYKGDKFEGKSVLTEDKPNANLYLWDSAPLEVTGKEWSAVATTLLTAKTTGIHTLSFLSVGPGRLYADGKLVADLWDWSEKGDAMFDGSDNYLVDLPMTAGRAVSLRIEMTNELMPRSKQEAAGETHRYGGCRLGFKEADTVDYIAEAVAVAKAVDVAVVVVGLDAEWESEGYDRKNMVLPVDGSQDRLIEAVLKANPNTVVVCQSGSPVTMPWAEDVPAILQGWYQGQESGNALADVLFGKQNPSGKLPCSWPKRVEDTPAFVSWPGEDQMTVYGEGLYVGYRHYDRANVKPLFHFGHGLSYTAFEYGRPELSDSVLTKDSVLELTMAVTNVGEVDGAETVQFYVRDVVSRLPRPEKELKAFEKVVLKTGQTKHFRVALDKHAVGYYDTKEKAWVAEEGEFEVLVGASTGDIRHKAKFEVKESFSWVF